MRPRESRGRYFKSSKDVNVQLSRYRRRYDFVCLDFDMHCLILERVLDSFFQRETNRLWLFKSLLKENGSG